ncbi:MAG: hypothetical protein II921_00480 [Treponema sp.]|nr:hypothetical protein [Treponema sp.]
MTSLNDFIKLEKYNSLSYFDMGMSTRNYSLWSSFIIPDGMGEEDISEYTRMRIAGGKDMYRLFSLSVSECAVDNQKKIDGVVPFDFVPLCRDPAEFVSLVQELGEKCVAGQEISYFLGVDVEKEPNLFLVDSFFESNIFSGLSLSVPSSEQPSIKKASELLALSKKFKKKAKLSVPLAALKKIVAGADIDSVQIVNPEFDREMIDIMRDKGFQALFTVSTEPLVIRKFFDSGVGVSLASGKYLFSGETLSTFAFRLFSSGFFSKDEVSLLLGLSHA